MHSHANDVQWLLDHAMLEEAKAIAARFSGQGRMWQHPYAQERPRAAAAKASVWFTAYPAAVITREGESVLQTLGSEELWQAFQTIGIQALHNGPMKVAGGIRVGASQRADAHSGVGASQRADAHSWVGASQRADAHSRVGASQRADAHSQEKTFTPTIDGYFDRIALAIDPTFGTEAEFAAMSRMAAKYNAIVIDDIVPGHTGKGADFRLAERNYGDYPGLYHMVEIRPADWPLLPPVPTGRDSVNLLPATVDQLQAKGYIVGQLQRTIFYEPGVKETDWSATAVVQGVDGVERRWVYLHYFKEGQPTLNWLDPSFAAQRLVMGDALHSLSVLGAGMLRLDANGFLGIEPRSTGPAWSEGHPLSLVANQLIAGMVRKVGGFTFQELNLTADDIAAMAQGGADLSYDFITRPAYHHALVTGDTEFLRLMLTTMQEAGIDPASLIHALQNHDELTLELVHFWTLHQADRYTLQGAEMSGLQLREKIRAVMYERLTGAQAPYNLPFVTNGVACTTVSVIAAALGIADLTQITPAEKTQIQRIHLLLAMYNALQPGVFALSGWDLVGALPLPAATVAPLLADGDTRWINRGAYDLMDANPTATMSQAGLPKAAMLYGSLTAQLQQPDSFANQLRQMLAVRQQYRIYESRQLPLPQTHHKGLLVVVHELPESLGIQVTALNFGASAVDEVIALPGLQAETAVDLFTGNPIEQSGVGTLTIQLTGFEGKAYRVAQS